MLKRLFVVMLALCMTSAITAQNICSLRGQLFANAVYRSRTQTLLAEVDPYFTLDCGVSTDLFDKRLSLFLNVNDLFNTVRTGGESVNPYNPSTSESVHTSRYVSFGLTWRLGRTEMEGQQTRDKKGSRHKGR